MSDKKHHSHAHIPSPYTNSILNIRQFQIITIAITRLPDCQQKKRHPIFSAQTEPIYTDSTNPCNTPQNNIIQHVTNNRRAPHYSSIPLILSISFNPSTSPSDRPSTPRQIHPCQTDTQSLQRPPQTSQCTRASGPTCRDTRRPSFLGFCARARGKGKRCKLGRRML